MNTPRLHRQLFVLVCIGLMAATTAQAEAPVVRSDSPKQAPRVVELEESWRVGGEDGDIIFGMMIDSVEDDDGNVYMLDAQIGQIEVFSRKGEHLRTVSRQGDGPGEVRNPQNMVLFPDGNLGILELFPARFVNMSLDGVPKDNLVFGGEGGPQTGFSAALQATCRARTILVAAQHSQPSDTGQSRTQYLARLSESGEEMVRYRESTITMDFTAPVFSEKDLLPAFFLASTVDNEGRIYTPRARDQYAVEVYAPDGTLEKVIERKFQPRKRDENEIRRLNALIDAWMQGFPGDVERRIEDIEPVITDLHVDDEGLLWVQHSRSGRDQADGVLLTYDTFSPDGTWLQEVSFKADGNPDFDGLRFLGEDRVLFIKGYVLARWASRGAQNANFGEEEAEAMEVMFCTMKTD